MDPGTPLEEKAARWRALVAPHARPPVRPDPARSALLVVDLQEHFRDIIEPILPNIRTVLGRFRDAGRPVVFTRHRHVDPPSDAGMMAEWWDSLLVDGAPDAELLPEARPRPGETLIEKTRYSAFLGTPLDGVLQSGGVGSVVVAGVMTNLCCETTARDAFMRGYRVYVLLDGTATSLDEFHAASLLNLAYGFAHVVTCGEMLDLLTG